MTPKGPDPATVRHITTWLNEMAALARHPNDERPTTKSLALMATMLTDDFPAGAFTIASMQATLRGNVFFPLYEEVRRCIGEWWRDNKPASTAVLLEGPAADPSLSDMDRSWLAYWYRRIAEIDAGPVWRGTDPTQAPRARLASLIRQQAPDAWKIIARGEPAYPERSVRPVVDNLASALRSQPPTSPASRHAETQQTAVSGSRHRRGTGHVDGDALAALRVGSGIASATDAGAPEGLLGPEDTLPAYADRPRSGG